MRKKDWPTALEYGETTEDLNAKMINGQIVALYYSISEVAAFRITEERRGQI